MASKKSDPILNQLIKYSKGDFQKDDLEKVRQFVFDISHVINKKIATLEDEKKITIKLPPLQKRIPTRKNNRRFISMPVTGVASYNTGVHGSFSFPTTVNVSPALSFGPLLLDPFGNSEETIIDRINKIKKYIKIYNKVKTDAPGTANEYYVTWNNGYGDNIKSFSGYPLPTTEELEEAEKNYKKE